jgi:hypothetical protein
VTFLPYRGKNHIYSNVVDKMPFFNGPFKPKYKDINLYDTYRKTYIKDFSNIVYERILDREKQKALIKKFKKDEFNPRKFYT